MVDTEIIEILDEVNGELKVLSEKLEELSIKVGKVTNELDSGKLSEAKSQKGSSKKSKKSKKDWDAVTISKCKRCGSQNVRMKILCEDCGEERGTQIIGEEIK